MNLWEVLNFKKKKPIFNFIFCFVFLQKYIKIKHQNLVRKRPRLPKTVTVFGNRSHSYRLNGWNLFLKINKDQNYFKFNDYDYFNF